MKSIHLMSFAAGAMLVLGMTTISQSNAQSNAHVYESRTYFAMPGKLDELKARFRDHTITIFNSHHMKSVGYWIPQENTDNKLVYILEHPSLEDAKKNWAAFRADPEWQKVAKESEANGKLVDHVGAFYMIRPTFPHEVAMRSALIAIAAGTLFAAGSSGDWVE